jgi:hypothetical protein
LSGSARRTFLFRLLVIFSVLAQIGQLGLITPLLPRQ